MDNESFPIVVKPVESCGSDGVKLCNTKDEAMNHFHLLIQSQRKVGAQGAAVLCQEFFWARSMSWTTSLAMVFTRR